MTELRHRHDVHVLPSCVFALDNDECFGPTCDKCHDNFETRREKEKGRKMEAKVHVLPTCLVALIKGGCWDTAFARGHDNFAVSDKILN